jgi:hypothetical protein
MKIHCAYTPLVFVVNIWLRCENKLVLYNSIIKVWNYCFHYRFFFLPFTAVECSFFMCVQFVLFVSEDHKENVRCVHYCIGLVCIRKCTQYFIIIICIHWYVYTFEWKIRSTEKCNTFLFQAYLLFFTCIFFTVISKVTLSWWDL